MLSIYLSIYLSIDFLLRRLIINCVCYFPEFVSFKTFRETSFESIWAYEVALGIDFGIHLEKNSVRFEESVLDRTLGPFWNCFWCSGPPQKEPFWKPFRLMLPSRGALRLKIEDFGGVWLQSVFLKRFCIIFGGVLGSENLDFAWEG